MPHQCLHCGHIFEDSAGTYHRGCPKCHGHRFFFTKQPPTTASPPTTRSADVNEKIMNLIIEKHETIKNGENKAISLTPKELRQLIIQKIEESTKKKNPTLTTLNGKRPQTPTKDLSEHPQTIDIEQTGNYHIDLKGLLEKEPIVIQKDGTYTIHLPSAFQTLRKKHD
jgi:predicted  nucleic acid-binding Zn-ribbon protein